MPAAIQMPSGGFPIGVIQKPTGKYLLILSFLKNQKSSGADAQNKYLNEVSRYAKREGFDHIEIFIPKDNVQLIEIYEEFGFIQRETNVYAAMHFPKTKGPGNHQFDIRCNGIRKGHMDQIQKLYTTLSQKNTERVIEFERIQELVQNDKCRIFSIHDHNTISAMATIVTISMYDNFLSFGMIEDVVRNPLYKGHGLGDVLMEKALSFAIENRFSHLMLTSNTTREAANKLYTKYGFICHDYAAFRYMVR